MSVTYIPAAVWIEKNRQPAAPRCAEHRAYEPDNCPLCGTSAVIGGRR